MQSDKDKILELLINRRDFWQKQYESAKVNDFFNANNFKAMVSELNAIILAVHKV